MITRFLLPCLIALVFLIPARAADLEMLPQGNFADMSTEELKQKWISAGYAGARKEGNKMDWLTTTSGKTILRIEAMHEDPNRRHFIAQTKEKVQVNPNWKRLKLGAVFRVVSIESDPTLWKNFRFRVVWFNDTGDQLDSKFFLKTDAQSDEWIVDEEEFDVPPGATTFSLDVGSQNAGLIAEVAEISIKPVGIVVESDIPTLNNNDSSTDATKEKVEDAPSLDDQATESYAP